MLSFSRVVFLAIFVASSAASAAGFSGTIGGELKTEEKLGGGWIRVTFTNSDHKLTGTYQVNEGEVESWDTVDFDEKTQILYTSGRDLKLSGRLQADGSFNVELYLQNVGKAAAGILTPQIAAQCAIATEDLGPAECAKDIWLNAVATNAVPAINVATKKLAATGYVSLGRKYGTTAILLGTNVSEKGKELTVTSQYLVSLSYHHPTNQSKRSLSAVVSVTAKSGLNFRSVNLTKVLGPDAWK